MKNYIFKSFLALFTLSLMSTNVFALDGSGTEADPYLIQTAQDLSDLSINGTTEWKYYKITADIDMNGYEFTGLADASGKFRSYLDGDGHLIKNLTISKTTTKVGLAPHMSDNSYIKNLGLIRLTINAPAAQSVGAFAGMMTQNNTTVENCFVEGGTIISDRFSGGIVGRAYAGIIKNCYALVDLQLAGTAWNVLGGISGDVDGWNANPVTVENVVFYGTLDGGTGNTTPVQAVVGAVGSGGPNTLTNLYYAESVGIADANATEILDADLDDSLQYVGFNFDTVWKMQEGKAVLKHTPLPFPAEANAGPDIYTFEGFDVALDGTNSTLGTDGVHLEYDWQVVSGHAITFSYRTLTHEWPGGGIIDTTILDTAFFTVPDLPRDDTIVVELTVSDELSVSEPDTVLIFVRTAEDNIIPTAIAGSDQTIEYNRPYSLSASGSDADEDSISYHWTVPSTVYVEDTTAQSFSYTAPYPVTGDTTLMFILNTRDYPFKAYSEDDTVLVHVTANVKPLGTATASETEVESLDLVVLEAVDVSDVNGDDVFYSWIVPEGIIVADSSLAKTTFTAPNVSVATDFVVTLVVNDGFLESTPSSITITVSPDDRMYPPTLGIDENSLSNISVYPNPSSGLFTISVGVESEVNVTNIVGKVLHTQTLYVGENQIDLRSQAEGIYFVNIMNNSSQRTVKIQFK